MTIANASNVNDTNHMSETELDALVLSIVSSHNQTPDSYTQASQTYGFFFFEGESAVFKQKLCSALDNHFAKFNNTFWRKAGKV